jgi:hypothetical protein
MNRVTSFAASGVVGVLACALCFSSGCESSAQTGGLAGAGIGALAGQAIGGSTGATLAGAAVGAGIGYVIGNEKDKKEARTMTAASHAETHTHYPHNQVGQLGNTRWRVVNITPSDKVPAFASKIIEFRPTGRVIATTTFADGHLEVSDENYRVVDNVLIVNRRDFLINATFSIQEDQLIIIAEEFRAVLERMP